MPATISPCRRPKVPVVEGPKGAFAYCEVTSCEWSYGPGVKTDVEENARRHRAEHRDAVPTTDVSEAPDGGYIAICACGWTAPTGTVTRADNEASLAAHLANAHGLVS